MAKRCDICNEEFLPFVARKIFDDGRVRCVSCGSNEINVGDKIKVYDSCVQCDVIEPVVRIVGQYIYSKRDNWLGYDERLSTAGKIKEVIRK